MHFSNFLSHPKVAQNLSPNACTTLIKYKWICIPICENHIRLDNTMSTWNKCSNKLVSVDLLFLVTLTLSQVSTLIPTYYAYSIRKKLTISGEQNNQ